MSTYTTYEYVSCYTYIVCTYFFLYMYYNILKLKIENFYRSSLTWYFYSCEFLLIIIYQVQVYCIISLRYNFNIHFFIYTCIILQMTLDGRTTFYFFICVILFVSLYCIFRDVDGADKVNLLVAKGAPS